MVDDDLRCVLERYGLREFVHYEISCYVPGVHGTGWVRMGSSAAGTNTQGSSVVPVVRLVCVGSRWLAMVPRSKVTLFSGLWDEYVPGMHDLGVAIVVPEAEKVCNGVAYTCMSIKRGMDSGPDAVRVAVALHRIVTKDKHRVPLLPTRAESLFRRAFVRTPTGRDCAAVSAAVALGTLTIDNVRVVLGSLRGGVGNKHMDMVDMEDVFAVYGLLRGVDYTIHDAGPFDNSKGDFSKVSFVVVRQTKQWFLRASEALRSYWHTALDVCSVGEDVNSNVARSLWLCVMPGFCPKLRHRKDSGPNVLRVTCIGISTVGAPIYQRRATFKRITHTRRGVWVPS